MKISFFQERRGSCDLESRPLWELLCWSVGHLVPTPKIATSPWNDFSLPHLLAGNQRSSADVYHHFLAGMSAQNNGNRNSREAKTALVGKSAARKLEGTAAFPHHLSRGYRTAHQPPLLQGGKATIRATPRSPQKRC